MGRLVRSFTLDPDVSRAIDTHYPNGERSAWVNQALRDALQSMNRNAEAASTVFLATSVPVIAFLVALVGA